MSSFQSNTEVRLITKTPYKKKQQADNKGLSATIYAIICLIFTCTH